MRTILDVIDNISEETYNTEFAVECALCDSYEKAVMILEEYDNCDTSVFPIFQEGGIMDEVRKNEKKDNSKIKSILMFIPRLITALFNALLGKLKKTPPVEKAQEMAKEISNYKITKEEKKSTFKKIMTHPIVKTISIAGCAIGAKEAHAAIKDMHKRSKFLKAAGNDVDTANKESEEFFKRISNNEYIQYFIDDETGELFAELPVKIDNLKLNLLVKYFAEAHSCLERCKSKMISSKSYSEVFDNISRCQLEISQIQILEKAFISENTEKSYIYKVPEMLSILQETVDWASKKWRVGGRLKKDYESLINSIPVDKIDKSVIGKFEKGKIKSKMKDGLSELDRVQVILNSINATIANRVGYFVDSILAIMNSAYVMENELANEIKKNNTEQKASSEDKEESTNTDNETKSQEKDNKDDKSEKVYSGKEVIKLLKERDPDTYGNSSLAVNNDGKIYNSKKNSPPKPSYNYKKDENGKSKFVWNDEKNGYILEYFYDDSDDDFFD